MWQIAPALEDASNWIQPIHNEPTRKAISSLLRGQPRPHVDSKCLLNGCSMLRPLHLHAAAELF